MTSCLVPPSNIEQLKLYYQPIAAGAPSSPGNASIWAPELASTPCIDSQWAYYDTKVKLHHLCPPWARQYLGPVLARLPPTFVGKNHIKDGKQQGLMLLQLVEGPVLTYCPTHQQDSQTPLALPCYVLATWARPLLPTMQQRSSPALTKTTLWPVTSLQPTPRLAA